MRKFFSLIAAVLFAGSMMAETYTRTAYADLQTGDQVIITMQKGDDVFAASNDQGTSKAPVATAVTVADDAITTDATNILWTVAKDGDNITFTTGEDALYCTNTNNGVRVGSNSNNVFSIDATSGYLYNNGTSRYIGVYNSADWRCYTSVNANIKDQTLAFFVAAGGDVPPTPVDTFTVAGSDAAIFGTEWDAANTANDMVKANGMYKWEKAELNLAVGIIEFKVVKNHSWDIAYPSSNYEVNIAEAGEYTLTITFDPATEAVAAEAVKKVEPTIPTTCAEAREAILALADGAYLLDQAEITLQGYVTEIATEYSDQYHNISFWMADDANGGQVIQAYRAACASEADAPVVGDKVEVVGKMKKYVKNNVATPEFDAACTFTIIEHPTPAPVAEYYLVGSFNEWTASDDYKFVANAETAGEYMLEGVALSAEDSIKVLGILGETTTWYPDNAGNYVIAADGEYDIYFRPDGQGGEDWYYNFFFVAPYEAPVIPQYEVAEAIAAGLTDDTEILVRGVITKMEFKGKNFAKYGSVNIYVADATGAEGEFEFYNCYSLEADTFRTSTPAYDAESTSWAQFTEVVDENQVAVHVGDTVIAFGKYKLYNSTHELNTGCYLTSIVPADSTPTAINNVAVEDKAVKVIREGQLFIMKNGVLYNAQGAIVK